MKQEISVFINKIEEFILLHKAHNQCFVEKSQNAFSFGKVINLERCTKLLKTSFIDPELLSKKDLKKVIGSLETMLECLGLSVGFPRSLPPNMKYSFLFSVWSSGNLALTSEGIIEVCNYNIDECPFPGYCKTCEEISSRIRMDQYLQRGGFDEVDEIS